MPSDVEEEDARMPGWHCNRKCPSKFLSTEEAMRAEWMQKGAEKQSALWVAVNHQVVKHKETSRARRVVWRIGEVVVCKPYWCHLHAACHRTVEDMQTLIAKGHDSVPPKLPRAKKNAPQARKADSWFLNLYLSLAQAFATEQGQDDGVSETLEFAEVANEAHPLWGFDCGFQGGWQFQELCPQEVP